jgi:hypothetical protein
MVEIVTESRHGQTFEFLSIDGIKLDGHSCAAMCVIDYDTEEAKAAGINFIQKVVDNSDKRGMELVIEVARAYQMAAMHHELGIPTDAKPEAVKVNDKDMNIMYSKKAIYNRDLTKEIANCKDLPDMPKEAIKAVLIERAKNC